MTDGESHIENTPEMYGAVKGTGALQMENKMRVKCTQQRIILQP